MTTDVEARSGVSAASFRTGQIPGMKVSLLAHPGSWNVVSVSGGADDGKFTFDDAIQNWYEIALLSGQLRRGVWTANASSPGCPDTDDLYATARAQRTNVRDSLAAVLIQAVKTSPGVRLLDLYYPYVLPHSAFCAGDHSILGESHGTTAVVNMLDSAHDGVPAEVHSAVPSAGPVYQLDLRDPSESFGAHTDPRDLLQETAYFGYPHPSATGQFLIAGMASLDLSGS
jgi:hypothetical protein